MHPFCGYRVKLGHIVADCSMLSICKYKPLGIEELRPTMASDCVPVLLMSF